MNPMSALFISIAASAAAHDRPHDSNEPVSQLRNTQFSGFSSGQIILEIQACFEELRLRTNSYEEVDILIDAQVQGFRPSYKFYSMDQEFVAYCSIPDPRYLFPLIEIRKQP